MGLPVQSFLEDFTPEGEGDGKPPSELRPRLIHRVTTPALTPRDIEKLKLEDAFERGVEHGIASARAAAEAERTALVARCEVQIEESRQAFAGDLADRLCRDLRTSFEQAQSIVSGQAATALLPVFRRAISAAAILELSGELAALLNEAPALVASIAGPADFTSRLQTALTAAAPDLSTRILFVAGHEGATEITVRADKAVIETRLGEWLARLDEASR